MAEELVGKRIAIPGQFAGLVTVDSATTFEDVVLLRVRTQQEDLRDASISVDEAKEILVSQN